MHDLSDHGVGWGSLALSDAGLAQGQNHKGFDWFLWSLIGGSLATFFLVARFVKLPNHR